ncbi:MAG TPA: DUF1499 domain-containing protein [Acidobacteriota bacterium]|nr:DUF1499 domain-containing protein [Acidobacteriota bacterium]
MVMRYAVYLPCVTVGVMIGAVAAIHVGAIGPLGGFSLFVLSWALGGVLSGLLGLLTWRRARRDSRSPAAGQRGLAGGALLVLALIITVLRIDAPAIHDITTSPDDAPSYRAALDHEDNAGRDLTYPHGGDDVSVQQRRAYPDLRTIVLDLDAGAAHSASLQAAEAIGLTIAFSSRMDGHIEAYAVSSIFAFVDDVVVRIRPSASGSAVDVRSTSRLGRSDLGANAARIRAFALALGAPFDSGS